MLAVADEAYGSGAEARSIGWQEAVARLTAERTRAETCAGLLKKHGDEAARDRGALAYGMAKAEVDGVISGLVTALARGEAAASLPTLEDQLKRGVAARETFCAQVAALVPERAGEKGVLAELAVLAGALVPLIGAVRTIWLEVRKADRLMAKTIETQLEAARWQDFAAIAASA